MNSNEHELQEGASAGSPFSKTPPETPLHTADAAEPRSSRELHSPLRTQSVEYRDWLLTVKRRIAAVQMKIAMAASSELIRLYYDLGAQIVDREQNAAWGSAFIDCFSRDLKTDFPGISGFSAKNLRYCRAFYRFYSEYPKWQQAVAKFKYPPADEKWQQLVAKMQKGESGCQLLQEFHALTIDQIPWGADLRQLTDNSNRRGTGNRE